MLDTKKEHIAVTEANKLGIPVVAVVDTNVDPELVQYPIPGNDDAIRANSLLARVIADAVEEGRFIAAKRDPGSAPVVRSAEEEAAFVARQTEARNEAARAQAERDARLAAARTATPAAEPAEAPAQELSAEPDAADAEAAAEPCRRRRGRDRRRRRSTPSWRRARLDESNSTDADTPEVAAGTPADVATELNEES